MKKTIVVTSVILASLVIMNGCANTPEDMSGEKSTTSQSNNMEISATDVYEKISENKSIKIVDVRTQEEYDEQHISSSTLVPLDSLQSEISKIESIKKSDEIIVYCRSGRRSAEAYNILTSLGYTNVKSMAGGINEWAGLGYDVCFGESLTC